MSKILIIEDDLDMQKIYGDLLRINNHEVISATNGTKGFSLAKTEGPDIILLDLMLPGKLNGFDVLENLKKDENLKNIPVIVLTNLDSEHEVASTIGATNYLVKANVSPKQVVEKVEEHLK